VDVSNRVVIDAWKTVLFEKCCRFKHLLVDGLSQHSNAGFGRWWYPKGAQVLDVGCGFGDSTVRMFLTARWSAGVAAGALVLTMAAGAEVVELTGAWTGMLTGVDGSSAEVQVDFGPGGFPLYSYTDAGGRLRQVELTRVGQVVEYVPMGGGVQRVEVKSLEKATGRLSVLILATFEKASQGYLDQQQEAVLFEYALVSEGLKVRVTSQATSHFGDKDMIVGGDSNAAVAEGLLQKRH
jgi:hypothetical protein